MPQFLNTVITPALNSTGLLQIPMGSPEGLTLSPNSTIPDLQLDIAPGRAIVAVGSNRYVAINSSTMTKRLDAAWSIGSGSGGLFSGRGAGNTTYHVFIIRRATDGAIDFGFDASASAANAPSGWNARMIGSIRTLANAWIRGFFQAGDRFQWTTEGVIDLATGTTSTSTTNLQALTVPTGIRVCPFGITDHFNPSSVAGLFLSSPDAFSAQRHAYSAAVNTQERTPFLTLSNTSGQVRLYSPVANTNTTIYTYGFFHPRGAWS
jgi:hypothetical protein